MLSVGNPYVAVLAKGGSGSASAVLEKPASQEDTQGLVALAYEAHRRWHNLYEIGPGNRYVGKRVRVTWAKPWGKKPAGFTAEGILLRTWAKVYQLPNGAIKSALFGELKLPSGEILKCPWSRNYLIAEPLEEVGA